MDKGKVVANISDSAPSEEAALLSKIDAPSPKIWLRLDFMMPNSRKGGEELDRAITESSPPLHNLSLGSDDPVSILVVQDILDRIIQYDLLSPPAPSPFYLLGTTGLGLSQMATSVRQICSSLSTLTKENAELKKSLAKMASLKDKLDESRRKSKLVNNQLAIANERAKKAKRALEETKRSLEAQLQDTEGEKKCLCAERDEVAANREAKASNLQKTVGELKKIESSIPTLIYEGIA